MGRQIVTATATANQVGTRAGPDQDVKAAPAAGGDNYSDKLLKLIPGEVIGVYLSMVTILKHSKDEVAPFVPWLVFVFGIAATWFYLRVTLKVEHTRQLMLSVLSFCVWAFTIGVPFDQQPWYNGTYAGLMLVAFTFIAPKIPLEASASRRPKPR